MIVKLLFGGEMGLLLAPAQLYIEFSIANIWLKSEIFVSVLDWLVQPKPRWLGGNGWLLDGPEEILQGEPENNPGYSDPEYICNHVVT